MASTDPPSSFDLARALVDGHTDIDIAKLLSDVCDGRSMIAYANARQCQDPVKAAEFGRAVNHYRARAAFWRRARR